MKTIRLNNGVEMPVLGYGTYQVPQSDTERCVSDALQAGYRLIDTAQYYGNESGVGDAVAASGIPRGEVFITTKLQSNRDVPGSVETSLRKLKTDYVDLLLIHWVMGNDLRTWREMERLCQSGIVRAIGLSNFYGRDYENIIGHCEIMPAVNQLETHVFYQNKALRKLYEHQGVRLEAWSPFGAGRAGMFGNPILKSIAGKHSRTVAQVILRFLVQNGIIAIPKTTHVERMKENLCIFDFTLDWEDIDKIEAMDRNESLFGWY